MIIKKFNELLKESASVNESMTLYRVVPLKGTEKLDVNDPGKYYVTSKSNIKDIKLKSKAKDYYLVTVKANADDVDQTASEKETEAQGTKVVALKNGADKEIVKVEPYKMSA